MPTRCFGQYDRRKQLSAEAEFYGAMDGASRFTQRDAVASILITGINIAAGFLIGVLQHGMDLKKAISTYTILTIGDGLVTVIPALMISICGALIVTRAGSDARVGAEFRKQIFGASQPLLLASGVLVAMAAFPGFPKIPFLVMSASTGYAGWRLKQTADKADAATAQAKPAAAASKDQIENLLKIDLLAVEVGLGLVKFVEGGPNSPLLRRIAGIRRQLATELGYVLPPVRVTDNLSLKAREYVLTLKGAEVARYEIAAGAELAIAPSGGLDQVEGEATHEPAFGIPAVWVRNEALERAKQAGYTVVDGISVLGTHLSEVIRRYAHELFTRQEAKKLLDRVSEENQKVVEDLVPKLLPLSSVQRVLQNLLRERVSIRDGASILESLSEAAQITKNPVLLTEYVRQALRRMLVRPYVNAGGDLAAYLVDGAVEQVIEAAIEHGEQTSHLNLPPQRTRELLDKVARVAGPADTAVVLLCGAAVRTFLRQIVESSFPNVSVLSHSEIPSGLRVVSLGVIR